MRVGIVCSAQYSLGHAAVARALAECYIDHYGSAQGLFIISDQIHILRERSFFRNEINLINLGLDPIPVLDLLILDTIPFRRADVLYNLLRTLPTPKPLIIVGHTGWVPYMSKRHVREWQQLLLFLGAPPILLYHGASLCSNNCHISSIKHNIKSKVYHSGLLMPIHKVDRRPSEYRFIALSGGGYRGEEIYAQAKKIITRFPNWECDYMAGPYSETLEPLDNIRILTGISDIANRLGQYQFSITRAGYSSCCEHIHARIASIILPLDNAEQRANARWARTFIPTVNFSDSQVSFNPDTLLQPTAFNWSHIERIY